LKTYHSIQAWFPFIFGCSKNRYIHCKTMFTCWVSVLCNGFTLGPMAQATLVYLWSKVVYLFCFTHEIHWTGILGLFGKLSRRRGASAWFHGIWTCRVKVHEYWIISSLKIRLNRSWRFQRNWNVPLVVLEISWWSGFNGIYLVNFGFKMWEILIFKWFLQLKIQINSKKPGVGRKNQLRTL
jgi:hypothetical protein